jgi:hypothetical protein
MDLTFLIWRACGVESRHAEAVQPGTRQQKQASRSSARPARHSFHHVPLFSGCDSARQRAGKCRAGRGGSICHADHTSGRFAVGQEPSRCSGTKLGGGMAFHFFTRSDRRLPGPGKAGATWDSRSISSAFAIRGTQPREILERGECE